MRRLVPFSVLLAVAMTGPVSRAATPATCASPCTISAGAATNFLPPAAGIANGATVRWQAIDDFPHASGDTNFTSSPCFGVPVNLSTTPISVRFDLNGSEVVATQAPGTPDELSALCTNTVALPGGGVLLPYRCYIHPEMHAILVIEP